MSCVNVAIGESYGMSAIPPLDVDLLRTFVMIADRGSFTRAAERIGRSQPAVSLQVQRLESLVGHRLFTRGKGGGPQLTPHDERLLERAREMTALNDSIVGSFRAARRGAAASGAETPAADLPSAASARSKRPTIAVLPFLNMCDDSDQDYFVDGMVDDLITGLSRIKWLLVIARNSSFAYKGRSVDVRQVGRELGVRYVLVGGVRKAGSRLRVNAQLLDAGAATPAPRRCCGPTAMTACWKTSSRCRTRSSIR
jgi:TolB-like protein